MMMTRLLPSAGLLLLLSACIPQEPLSFSRDRAETAVSSVRPYVITGSGTTTDGSGSLLTEQLLPNGMIMVGNPDAPLSLLVITEHHCHYCREFQSEHFPMLVRDYVSKGSLSLQFAILPLRKYEGSSRGATVVFCAARQGKGFMMMDLLFSDAQAANEHAQTLDLDTDAFATCMDAPETADVLESQKAWLRSLDVSLVPTLFLNGEKSVGLPYVPDLRGMIDKALTER